MEIYYYDNNGYLLGSEHINDSSPIPSNATTIVPNEIVADKRQKLTHGVWVYEDIPPVAPSTGALIADVVAQRKEQESLGVTINGARYSGESSNRQAIAEAIDYINATGATTFASWKDSDGIYHTNHPAQDVIDAYMAIGVKRSALIAKEAQFVADIQAGTLTDVSALDWTV